MPLFGLPQACISPISEIKKELFADATAKIIFLCINFSFLNSFNYVKKGKYNLA